MKLMNQIYDGSIIAHPLVRLFLWSLKDESRHNPGENNVIGSLEEIDKLVPRGPHPIHNPNVSPPVQQALLRPFYIVRGRSLVGPDPIHNTGENSLFGPQLDFGLGLVLLDSSL